jgi:hypothetical protein
MGVVMNMEWEDALGADAFRLNPKQSRTCKTHNSGAIDKAWL